MRVEARSGEVELSWTSPPGAQDVRLVRKVGSPPTGPDDGQVVPTVRNHAHDLGLDDDRVYHYGLFARYKGPDGKMKPSRGVFVSTTPHRPAPAVEDLTFQTDPLGGSPAPLDASRAGPDPPLPIAPPARPDAGPPPAGRRPEARRGLDRGDRPGRGDRRPSAVGRLLVLHPLHGPERDAHRRRAGDPFERRRAVRASGRPGRHRRG